MKRRILLSLGLMAVLAGCRPNEQKPPVASRSGENAEPKIPPPQPRSPRELPAMQVAYDDPRLAGVRDVERTRDFTRAAHMVEDARRANAGDAASICAWAHLAGRLHVLANEVPEAVSAFDAVKDECPVSPYAKLRAAQTLCKAQRWDESLAHARAVPSTMAAYDEAKVVMVEALFGRGERVAGVALAREILAESPRGPRWIDMSIRVAQALLDGVVGPSDAGPNGRSAAREALELTQRVVVEAPKIAESSGAEPARQRALGLLRTTEPDVKDVFTEAERSRRVQGWLDANEPQRALTEANALVGSWPAKGKVGTLPCKVSMMRAQAVAKLKQPAADAWGDAIRTCTGDEQLVSALYNGGKASNGANRGQEAVDRFAKLEQQFPKHRLADDARLQSAVILRDSGDEPRFASMLLSMPDDYPEGDMRSEGLFRVALHRMTHGDWAGAKEPLDRIMVLDASDHHWATAGRAAYFRARVAEAAGQKDDARQRYVKIIEDYPMMFYMTQAYGRLASQDEALASRTLDAAVAREPAGGTFVTKEHPQLTSPVFDRAVHLLEVGEVEAARRELARGGIVNDDADHELLWILGDLYNRAGAPELGHAFSRGRLSEHLSHYPAGTWRFAWEVAYPRAFEPIVKKESEANGIPLSLTWGVMREESTFVADVKSHANAYGLMQLVLPTAKGVARGTGLPSDENALKRPDVNVALGTKLLAGLRGSYPANRSLAIAAYNAGGGAVNRWVTKRTVDDFDLFVENIPYEETRGYIKRVLSSQATFAFLYERPALKEVLSIPMKVVP
jgi:soluble lytic murein transglycosylase